MLTDAERIRHATKSGRRMLGPFERERCSKHKRRWITFRWTWDADEDQQAAIECGEPEIVRGCGTCDDEECADD